MALDRATTAREDPEWVGERLRDPGSRAVFASREGVLVREGEEPELMRRPLADLTAAGAAIAAPILLGLEGDGLAGGAALFAVDLETLPRASAEALTRGGRVVSLREAGAILPHPEGGLAAYLTALLNWHRTNHFCPNCGTATEVAQAGYSRRCPSCGAVHFPRTDPVVIMVVACGDRLLLGRHSGWPPNRYSVLAGFVAPGETLEEAVAREVREESGIEVADARYVASQPWPFPSSLMLGFEARSPGGKPTAGDGELEDVRWFTLAQARAAIRGEGTGLELPGQVSIARRLIEHWAAGKN
ncbi:MAG TPA: NAD(+) diphosphatase [Solirubrobacteraceae bacterium]|jgi:NAD+ diphosphatase|nr:NAD(+) diphosphatase [Solirubrobacteraceae bacterium]